MITDCALYRDGRREEISREPGSLDAALGSVNVGDFLWIGIDDPTREELTRVGRSVGLHRLTVDDALRTDQRPKVTHYADHLFVSLRSVSYRDDDITTHDVNVLLGARYLVIVRHGGPRLDGVRERAAGMIEALAHGPTAAMYVVIDTVVDRYEAAARELELDVEEVETSVFSADSTIDSPRIYRLKRETLEFRRAVTPLREPIDRFATTARPEEARPYFRDIADHLTRAAEAIDAIDHLLDNALDAHVAQLTLQQNADMRKLTAGATIFAVPTAIAGIYGMNFEHMPELTWTYGYPVCLAVIGAICAYIYGRFKRAGWL